MRVPALLLLSGILLALAPLPPAAQAHEVTCSSRDVGCDQACLVHPVGGLNHACTIDGVEVYQAYSCFPEGFHVEVLGVELRRCGPPKLP